MGEAMRRFLLCTLLLVAVLLLARGARSAGISWDVDDHGDHRERWRWSRSASISLGSGDEELHPFFDHGVAPRRGRVHTTRRLRRLDQNRPAVVGEQLRLRYRDRGYDRVTLESDTADWQPVDMTLDAENERWQIEVPRPEHSMRYRFVVHYDDGRERDRVDPSHSGRERDAERGWVSVLEFDREGHIRWPDTEDREGYPSAHDDYDLDVFSDIDLDYQRVDGWLLSTHPRFQSDAPWSPIIAGRLGYGFKSDRWSGALYLLQPLRAGDELRAVVSAYDMTDFTDRTGVTDFENTLSTLIFHEDNRDWFRREGASVGLEAEWQDRLSGRLEFRWDEYRSLGSVARAGWWGRDGFLPNRPVDEGRMRSIFLRARVGSPLHYFDLAYELSDPGLSSDFEFQQLVARYRARLRMGYSQFLDLRAQWGGNLSGSLPRQKRYLLGGIGTVRGYNYQSLLTGAAPDADSYGGEEMFLATAEYVLGVQEELQLALFADTGMAWADRDASIHLSDLSSSAGIGVIFGGDDGLRLDLIRTLDSGSQDFVLQGRLQRAF
jgi:hypothetical protein